MSKREVATLKVVPMLKLHPCQGPLCTEPGARPKLLRPPFVLCEPCATWGIAYRVGMREAQAG